MPPSIRFPWHLLQQLPCTVAQIHHGTLHAPTVPRTNQLPGSDAELPLEDPRCHQLSPSLGQHSKGLPQGAGTV